METRYKLYDTEDKNLYVGVESHYYKLIDAKQVYKESKNGEKVDDSIYFEIAKDGANEVEATIIFGVEEGERFALALLNLCHLIKR